MSCSQILLDQVAFLLDRVELLSAQWQHQQYATEDGSCCCSYLVLPMEQSTYHALHCYFYYLHVPSMQPA